MNILDAMQIGYAKVGKQIRGRYFEFCDEGICGACALGCAFLAVADEEEVEKLIDIQKHNPIELDSFVYDVMDEKVQQFHTWRWNIQDMNDMEELSIAEIVARIEKERE